MNTQTKTIDLASVKQNIDLREWADRYTTLRRESNHELAGPCPKCGGTDRFHCTDEWFFCRQCHPKRGDAIEFVMWLNSCDFLHAVAMLTNAPLPTVTATKRTPAVKPQVEQTDDWRRKATALVATAHKRLFDDNDEEAEAGRAYLDSRGIESHTWQAFKLGYKPDAALPGTWDETKKQHIQPKQPAITIPWYRNGKVVAVGYRFLEEQHYIDIDGKPRSAKKSSLFGGDKQGVLYGGQALDTGITGLSTLVICEGELNAVSIWQVARDTHLDVLSLGSESASITPAMVEHASRYATVITWLDHEDYVKKAIAVLPGAYGIKSIDGHDANDALKSGELGALLAMHRFQAARNRQEQMRLHCDLLGSIRVWTGPDAATLEVMTHIATVMGIST